MCPSNILGLKVKDIVADRASLPLSTALGGKMRSIIGLMIVAATVFTIRKYRRDPQARGVFVETFTDKRALLIGAVALGVNLFLASRVEGGMAQGWYSAIAVAAVVVAVAHLVLHRGRATE